MWDMRFFLRKNAFFGCSLVGQVCQKVSYERDRMSYIETFSRLDGLSNLEIIKYSSSTISSTFPLHPPFLITWTSVPIILTLWDIISACGGLSWCMVRYCPELPKPCSPLWDFSSVFIGFHSTPWHFSIISWAILSPGLISILFADPNIASKALGVRL